MNNGLHEEIRSIIAPLLDSMSLTLWGMELQTGGPRSVLRIYVEGPDGVTIDECAKLSRHTGLALDVEDIMPEAYTLEVSSPGLERPFFTPGQMEAYVGKPVEAVLKEPHTEFIGRRKFGGSLTAVNGEEITLAVQTDTGCEDITIHWDDVKKAKLVHIFPDTSKEASRAKKKVK